LAMVLSVLWLTASNFSWYILKGVDEEKLYVQ
jgi:hypothetical protein